MEKNMKSTGMTLNKSLNYVKQWSLIFNQFVRVGKKAPPVDIVEKDFMLLYEEIDEMKTTLYDFFTVGDISQIDMEDLRDDIGDVYWMFFRMCLLFGFDPDQILEKVYESNMTKICKTRQEAIDSCIAYRKGKHPDKISQKIECYYKECNEGYIIYRTDDHKVLKSINYKKPKF